MILHSLETENFKKLGTQTFTFTSGTNFIVGDNGQGKSTLLRAVATALYGVSALPGVASDVPTWGTSSWSLSLTLEHAGKTYTVKRTKSSARVTCGDDLVASGHTPCTKFLEDLTGLDLKDYNLLVHSRQGETGYILSYGATALQRKVEELSGVDHVEKIANLVRGKQEEGRVVAESLARLTLDDEAKDELKDKLEKVQADIQALKDQQDKLGEVKFEKPQAPESDPKALRKALRDYRNYQADLREYGATCENLREQIKDLVIPDAPEGSEADLVGKIQDLQKRKHEYTRVETQRESLENEVCEVDETDYSSKLDEARSQFEVANGLLKGLEDSVRELKSEVKHLVTHINDGVCTTCGTVLTDDLDEVRKKLSAAEGKLKEESAQMEVQQGVVDTLEKDIKVLESKIKDQKREVEKQAKIEKALKDLPSVTWLDEDESALSQTIKDLGLFQLQHEARALALESLKKLEAKLEKLVEPEAVKKVDEAECEAAEAEWAAYREVEAELDRKKSEYQHQVKMLEADLQRKGVEADTVVKELQRGEEVETRVQEAEALQDKCKRLKDYLKKRREDFLEQVWNNITSSAGDFLMEATEGWMTGVRMEDGKFLFEENGAWISAAEASGAQASFLGVALRVGLGRGLQAANELSIYDEPTAAMTEENARRLVSSLTGKQVFVITHRDTDQGLADNVIGL